MTIFAFFLGLLLGMGICFQQKAKFEQQLNQILESLPKGIDSASLPLISRIKRVIALGNQRCEYLETQLQTCQELLEKAPVGYLQVDEENQLLWCNEKALQLLQIQRWEPGQVRLLLEVVRSYELDQLIEQTRCQQQFIRQEWVFHPACADAAVMGEVRGLTIRASGFPLLQKQVGVFLENRQPLIQLRQSRNRWISDLAHELRTPLTSINLVAETLLNRLEQTKERRWLEKMLQETKRLINLVEDLLQVSQMDENPHKNLEIKPIKLRSLIDSVWQTLEPLARQKQLRLEYDGVDNLTVPADEYRLTQVFMNLLDNSIKYSPEMAAIRVEINIYLEEDAKNRVQINIIDSGLGFKDIDLPHVFERLYRGDPSRTQQQIPSKMEVDILKGNTLLQSQVSTSASSNGVKNFNIHRSSSGLGLAIVKQIILAHGGSIKAKNHPNTGGAWLQFDLPL